MSVRRDILSGGDRHARFEALLSALPPFAQDEVRRRVGRGVPPATAPELFEAVRSWLNGAGIAEGRGGFPGGRGKPGWTDYVAEQRRSIGVLRALVDAFGAPSGDIMDMLQSYERSFPPAVRRMGDGYEPCVDDEAGRLIYSIPVDSGFVSMMFEFEIAERDLQTLLADPYRRAILGVIAHTVLQHSMLRGHEDVTQRDFRQLVDRVLHASRAELAETVAEVERAHNINVAAFVGKTVQASGPTGTSGA